MSRIPKLPEGAPRSKEGWQLFEEGLMLILSKWDLFKSAVVEEWGGRRSRSKFEHIVEDLRNNCHEQWKEAHDLHIDTLDVYLIECLEEDFNIDFEDDGAVTEVSLLIQDFYRKCADGDTRAARALLDGLDSHSAMQSQKRGEDDEDDDEEDTDDDGEGGVEAVAGAGAGASSAAPPRRIVDEDGWETIVAKPPKKGAAKPAAAAASIPAAAAPDGVSGGDTALYSAASAAEPADAMDLQPTTSTAAGARPPTGDGDEATDASVDDVSFQMLRR